jgi:uncharacterized protein YbjT (DUF2867 family)
MPINPALLQHADQRRQHLENRIADTITRFAGSMLFVYLHVIWFAAWIGLGVEHYPFGLLTMIVPPVLVQPEAADDVAAALAVAAVGAPVNGTVELAGPERFRFDELTRRVLGANGDPRVVTADRRARYFGATLDDRSLIPGPDASIAPTRFEDWLSQTMVEQTKPQEVRLEAGSA